ncbi:MAG: tRNA (N6-isopentenyl adenosine(37)-C2)-methylthiotransferase MiaB, partial [Chloroflexi bacterium]|nr:tRNA (N6-isopentenyl adenosine(37)-C2)-methylthiotransferase MiaB [Chloroflexota bacterium]
MYAIIPASTRGVSVTTPPQTYYIWTVGCQMNKADSESFAAALEGLGLRPAAAI